MKIRLDLFFPCSQVEFKKLIKVIYLDYDYEEHLKKLKEYFQERELRFETLSKGYGKAYINKKQNVSDLMTLLQSRKHPNGLPITNEEYKKAKTDLSLVKNNANETLTSYKLYKRYSEQFKNLQKLLP